MAARSYLELDQKLERLFKEWKQSKAFASEYSKHFHEDGVFDGEKYLGQKSKILFLLKETNGGAFHSFKQFYDTYYNKCNPPRKNPLNMWRRIREWSEGLSTGKSYDIILKEDIARIQDENDRLRRVAVVNVKKNGGGAFADKSLLTAHAVKERWLILYQISLLDPDIIVCGGTWGLLQRIAPNTLKRLNDQDGGTLSINGKDILVIDMYHPAAFGKGMGKRDLYGMLMDKYNNLYSQIKK